MKIEILRLRYWSAALLAAALLMLPQGEESRSPVERKRT
jgi:hypothetical protein